MRSSLRRFLGNFTTRSQIQFENFWPEIDVTLWEHEIQTRVNYLVEKEAPSSETQFLCLLILSRVNHCMAVKME